MVVLDAKTFGADMDLSVLTAGFDARVYPTTTSDALAERVRDAKLVVTNKVPLRAEHLDGARSLKLIAVAATGYDIVDVGAAQKRGIAVANVPGYGTSSVAAHTFALYFHLAHHLAYHAGYCRASEWCASDTFTHLGRPWLEPEGLTWGVLGLGAIGGAVALRAQAFGFRVVYFSSSGQDRDDRWPRLELEAFLQACDVISIHAPLTPQTKGLISTAAFQLIKRSALLLNTSRGPIVDEQALALALRQGLLAGAALDVLSQEPPALGHPLLGDDFDGRLILSPHIAGLSVQARRRLLVEVRTNIDAFLAGQPRNLCTSPS